MAGVVQRHAVRIFLLAGSLGVAAAAGQDEGPPQAPYERGLYVHWVDDDGDCLDTRQEVLMAESRTPARLDPTGCRVAEGLWRDPFTDREITDPSALDIDHLVPLAEAHRSGASTWTPEERRRYANDLVHPDALVAVAAEVNRSKGDGDPAHWLPTGEDRRCRYVRKWVLVKATWGLDMDAAEREAVRDVLWNCDTASERLPDMSGGPCIDVNTASAQQLQAVRSIGPVRSGDIIEFRAANGPFRALEDLDDVPGIGPVTINSFREAGFCVVDTDSP